MTINIPDWLITLACIIGGGIIFALAVLGVVMLWNLKDFEPPSW